MVIKNEQNAAHPLILQNNECLSFCLYVACHKNNGQISHRQKRMTVKEVSFWQLPPGKIVCGGVGVSDNDGVDGSICLVTFVFAFFSSVAWAWADASK